MALGAALCGYGNGPLPRVVGYVGCVVVASGCLWHVGCVGVHIGHVVGAYDVFAVGVCIAYVVRMVCVCDAYDVCGGRRRRCVFGMFMRSPRGDFLFMWGCFIIYRINGYVLNVWLWRI